MTHDNYLAPGGKEYTITAGQLAGLTAKSKILDIACGRAVASINLAKRYGAQATAVDIEETFIFEGKELAKTEGVEKNIKFITADFNKLTFPKHSFDMIIAEGGALSYIGRSSGLHRAHSLLKKNGYIEISDLILRSGNVPKNIKELFIPGGDLETEDSYRTLLKVNHFELVFCSYIAQHNWQNYYENIRQNLKNRQGPFANKKFRESLTKEMDLFNKQKGIEHLGYLFMVAKKA